MGLLYSNFCGNAGAPGGGNLDDFDCDDYLGTPAFSGTIDYINPGISPNLKWNAPGLIFRNVTVAQGTLITARLRFETYDAFTADFKFRIVCESVDDADKQTNCGYTSSLVTTGNTDDAWTDVQAKSATASGQIHWYDCTKPVQVVINRAGWSSGNDLGIYLVDWNANNAQGLGPVGSAGDSLSGAGSGGPKMYTSSNFGTGVNPAYLYVWNKFGYMPGKPTNFLLRR